MALHLALPRLGELVSGFQQIFYPDTCVACNREMPLRDSCFCLRCQLVLGASDMHLQKENAFTERFWGRLPLESGAALYLFSRKSPIQRALHQLKYRNKPEIGLKIGREFGKKLLQSPHFQGVDAVVPVPLHPRKERLRGYNQSRLFAQGLAEVLQKPLIAGALLRERYTQTQTRKKRIERFLNVSDVFVLRQPERVRGKHLLLVDDILTTGATLETCGQALLEASGVRLSLATIAITTH
jgi:ComF family protein